MWRVQWDSPAQSPCWVVSHMKIRKQFPPSFWHCRGCFVLGQPVHSYHRLCSDWSSASYPLAWLLCFHVLAVSDRSDTLHTLTPSLWLQHASRMETFLPCYWNRKMRPRWERKCLINIKKYIFTILFKGALMDNLIHAMDRATVYLLTPYT